VSASDVPVAFANCRPPVNWLSVPEKVLLSASKVDEAAVTPLIVPQIMVLLELVWSAFEPEQVPKVEANVVEPILLTLNSVVVAEAVEEPIAKSILSVSPLLAWIETLANGEDDPKPALTAKLMMSVVAPKVKVFPPEVLMVALFWKMRFGDMPVSPIVTSPTALPKTTCSAPTVVSILNSGLAVVEVAMVKANGELFLTVVVALVVEKSRRPPVMAKVEVVALVKRPWVTVSLLRVESNRKPAESTSLPPVVANGTRPAESEVMAKLVVVALVNVLPPVQVLVSLSKVEDAAEPVTVPQTMVPDELTLSALAPEQVPKVEAKVVEPMFDIEKSVVVAEAVEEPMAKSVVAVSPLFVAIENLANGVLVPTPTAPDIGGIKLVEVAGKVPKSIPPMLS